MTAANKSVRDCHSAASTPLATPDSSRSSLVFTKYDDLRANQKAKELEQLDADRELSENECKIWADRLDRFFMMPRRKPTHQNHSAADHGPGTTAPPN